MLLLLLLLLLSCFSIASARRDLQQAFEGTCNGCGNGNVRNVGNNNGAVVDFKQPPPPPPSSSEGFMGIPGVPKLIPSMPVIGRRLAGVESTASGSSKATVQADTVAHAVRDLLMASQFCQDTYGSCQSWGRGQCDRPGVADRCPCMCAGTGAPGAMPGQVININAGNNNGNGNGNIQDVANDNGARVNDKGR